MINRSDIKRKYLMSSMAGFFAVMCGCGVENDRPELGKVSGIVSLDGEPLSNAGVSFRSVEGGRVASARTDAQGHYELIYLDNPWEVPGAKIGEHIVYVSTYLSEEDNGGPQPEQVPQCYRIKESVKRVRVTAGTNEIDLVLDSQCTP